MSAAKSDAGKQDKYNQIHTGRSTIKYILGQVQSNTYRGRITQVWNSNTSANERCFTYMLGASIIKIKCIHCGSIHMKMDFFAGFMCCQYHINQRLLRCKWLKNGLSALVGGEQEQEFVLVHFWSDHFNTTATKYWSSAWPHLYNVIVNFFVHIWVFVCAHLCICKTMQWIANGWKMVSMEQGFVQVHLWSEHSN